VAGTGFQDSTGGKIFPDSMRSLLHDRAIGVANNIQNTIQFGSYDSESRSGNIRLTKIEWHRKFSFSVACLVLFFIGAPLGSIIRKGGMGMPLVVAIIFFLLFHLLGMFGEKFVKEQLLDPSIGMWLAVITLTPVGIFLTYKAMHDSQLFSKEFYTRAYKKLKYFTAGLKSKKTATSPVDANQDIVY
jgi:lipopolysaccharide export system permease protein